MEFCLQEEQQELPILLQVLYRSNFSGCTQQLRAAYTGVNSPSWLISLVFLTVVYGRCILTITGYIHTIYTVSIYTTTGIISFGEQYPCFLYRVLHSGHWTLYTLKNMWILLLHPDSRSEALHHVLLRAISHFA